MFVLQIRDDLINIIINFIKSRILSISLRIYFKFIIITFKIELNSI